jgi:alanine racemase
MHRLGFEDDSMDELIATLKGNETVKVQSILSHLATSDDLKHRDFTLSKLIYLRKCLPDYSRIGNKPYSSYFEYVRISNYPEAQFDMVRLGIGVYGVSNDPAEQKYLENVEL